MKWLIIIGLLLFFVAVGLFYGEKSNEYQSDNFNNKLQQIGADVYQE